MSTIVEFCIIRPLPDDMPACPRCGQRTSALVTRKVESGNSWHIMCLNPACTFLTTDSPSKADAFIAWYAEILETLK